MFKLVTNSNDLVIISKNLFKLSTRTEVVFPKIYKKKNSFRQIINVSN